MFNVIQKEINLVKANLSKMYEDSSERLSSETIKRLEKADLDKSNINLKKFIEEKVENLNK